MAKTTVPLFPAFETPEFKLAMAAGNLDMQHVAAEISKVFPDAKIMPRTSVDDDNTVTIRVTL